MDQQKFIEELQRRSEKRKNQSLLVQSLYERYVKGDDWVLKELLDEIEKTAKPWVEKEMRNANFRMYNVDDVLQEARIGVWEALECDRKTGTVRSTFFPYAFVIYKNKRTDAFRKLGRDAAETLTSLDAPEGDTGKTKGENTPIPDEPQIDSMLRAEVYRSFLIIYIDNLMRSDTYPPRPLATYFARVLPHIRNEIPDRKAASAKWAFEHMKDKTMWTLKGDSEATLQRVISPSLHWGHEFVSQLNKEASNLGQSGLLRDVVFTEHYDTAQIEDWSEAMHETTYKRAKEEIDADQKLVTLAKEYVFEGFKIYQKMVVGGAER